MSGLSAKFSCSGQLDNLAVATEFVEGQAELYGLDTAKTLGLLLALEEAFVNICSYAYSDGAGEIELACGGEGDVFILEIADSGRPFDVLALPEPDTTLSIDDREIGGLGVLLIRRLTDAVSYRRENNRNILRMLLYRPEGGVP